MRLKDAVLLPARLAATLVKIAGRIAVGAAGFVLMGAGLGLIDLLGQVYIGIPVFLIGFLLLVKAIF